VSNASIHVFLGYTFDDLLSYDTIKVVKIKDYRVGIMHYTLQAGIPTQTSAGG